MPLFAVFKKPAIFGVALLGFLVIANQAARAETPHPAQPIWKQPNSNTLFVAQNETPRAGNDKGAPSSESSESESKTDEEKKSNRAEEKPLKDFKPSEKIEAEQAVDFPYDI
jgi:hypothetical protein